MLAHFIQQSNLLYFTFLVCLGSALQYSKGLTEGLLSFAGVSSRTQFVLGYVPLTALIMFEDYVYNVAPILYMMISNSFVASCVYFLLWVIAWWSVLLAIVKRAVWLKFPVKTIVGILILLVLDAYFMFLILRDSLQDVSEIDRAIYMELKQTGNLRKEAYFRDSPFYFPDKVDEYLEKERGLDSL